MDVLKAIFLIMAVFMAAFMILAALAVGITELLFWLVKREDEKKYGKRK